jgi:WXG100 family type VII secretion target
MSGEYTRANFGALQQGEQDFQQTYNATRQTLDELASDLQRSLSEWEGDAQAAYHQAKAQWDAASAHMATVMNALGGVIGTAHENYSGAERANSGMWGG